MVFIDDKHYIDLILQGHHASYRFLVDKYKKMVFSICLRVLTNTEDAEDAAQESFLKAFKQLDTFKGISKFSTWLYTITYRLCVSRLKENSLETTEINNELMEGLPNSIQQQPFSSLSAGETTQFVKGAIQKLPRLDAVIITLYYLDENSIKEIVEITGLSESNVKIKLFRARKELERSLRFLA